jgi:hypothetical protein
MGTLRTQEEHDRMCTWAFRMAVLAVLATMGHAGLNVVQSVLAPQPASATSSNPAPEVQ